jgi:hypothetical protein
VNTYAAGLFGPEFALNEGVKEESVWNQALGGTAPEVFTGHTVITVRLGTMAGAKSSA